MAFELDIVKWLQSFSNGFLICFLKSSRSLVMKSSLLPSQLASTG